MKRTILWGGIMGLLLIFKNSPLAEAAWQSAAENLHRPMEHVLFVSSPAGQVLLAAGEGRIWRRLGEEVAAQEVLLLPVGEEKVFDLYAAAEGDMYAATQGGLWQSTDAGVTWKEIFVINAETQGEALSVLRVGAEIWLGTGRGIFCLKPGGHWEKLSHLVNAERVAHLAQDVRAVYWATSSTLFRFEKNTGEVSTLFSTLAYSAEASEPEMNEDAPDQELERIKGLAVSDQGSIYLGLADRVMIYSGAGSSWDVLPQSGFPRGELTDLAVGRSEASRASLWVSTTEGVAIFESGRWRTLYEGMSTGKPAALAMDDRNQLWVAGEFGLFIWRDPNGNALIAPTAGLSAGQVLVSPEELANLAAGFAVEPSVRDVQRWVVAHAEVAPEKIQQWRRAAQRRAWLPSLSAGLDRSSTEKLHWDTGANPDTLVKGRDLLDWDIGLSWDLGDLIWNPDQTSIDSRSKLMVELREDLLDQATRLYFERRRLQVELLKTQRETGKVSLDQQWRVAELTALLDGMTGGKFSGSLSSLNP